MFVHFNALPVIEFDTDFLCAYSFGKRTPPNRDKNLIGIEFHLLAALGCRGGCAAVVDLNRAYLCFEMKNDTLRSQRALEQIREFEIETDRDTRQKFEDRYFGAEAVPNRTELETNRARADDKKFRRRFGEKKCFRAADDCFAIKLCERQLNCGATGCDNDVFRFDLLRLAFR